MSACKPSDALAGSAGCPYSTSGVISRDDSAGGPDGTSGGMSSDEALVGSSPTESAGLTAVSASDGGSVGGSEGGDAGYDL